MTRGRDYRYRAPWWLRNSHAQTMWGKFLRKRSRPPLATECIAAPDGDLIEIRHLETGERGVRVLLLHGLEGGEHSHYIGGALDQARRRQWGASLLVFRGCGSVPNTARRFYHSGETSDLDLIFRQFTSRWPDTRWVLLGVSLGGNVMLKWLGERAAGVAKSVLGAAAISVPFDLEEGARHISKGFARVYDRNFLQSLRRKALVKLARYPDLFDRKRLLQSRTIFDFDDAVTGPVHGFAGAVDYYTKSSSIGFLRAIAVPSLLLSAFDDPFLPPSVLHRVRDVARDNALITTEFHDHGGHVGFVGGSLPWRPFYYAEWRAFDFFDRVVRERA